MHGSGMQLNPNVDYARAVDALACTVQELNKQFGAARTASVEVSVAPALPPVAADVRVVADVPAAVAPADAPVDAPAVTPAVTPVVAPADAPVAPGDAPLVGDRVDRPVDGPVDGPVDDTQALVSQKGGNTETFFDTDYISREPVRYLFNIHSVGFVFKFSKQVSATPILQYTLGTETHRKRMDVLHTNVDGLHKVVYGPLFFTDAKGAVNPSNVEVSIVLNDDSSGMNPKPIFKKEIVLLDYHTFSSKYYYLPQSKHVDLTFAVCSCFNLYNDKVPDIAPAAGLQTLSRFTAACEQKKPVMIVCSGDIVYLSNACNDLSSYGVQNAYDQLVNLEETRSLWSNYTWVCVNDDHELSYNDGMKDSSNIQLLRRKLDENFPIGEQVMDPNKPRATYFRLKDVYFVTLDTVTERTVATDGAESGKKYSSILGDEQIERFGNMLACISALDGPGALIFVVVSKPMFGSRGGFAADCVRERDQVLGVIKKLGLKNVVFICGDSHFSDFTEVNEGGVTIREIRNSSITSRPRKQAESENPYQYPGSLSDGVNNFGFVNVTGAVGEYNVTYTNYTLKGEQFQYTWKM
jgi:hypothetical protein